MARPLRLEFAGAVYHVTSRGDRREDIYLNDEDRQEWMTVLGLVCDTRTNPDGVYDTGAQWKVTQDATDGTGRYLVQQVQKQVDPALATFIQENTGGSNSPYNWDDVTLGKIAPSVPHSTVNPFTPNANGQLTAESVAGIGETPLEMRSTSEIEKGQTKLTFGMVGTLATLGWGTLADIGLVSGTLAYGGAGAIGGGTNAAVQLTTTGTVDWRDVATSTVTAIAGGKFAEYTNTLPVNSVFRNAVVNPTGFVAINSTGSMGNTAIKNYIDGTNDSVVSAGGVAGVSTLLGYGLGMGATKGNPDKYPVLNNFVGSWTQEIVGATMQHATSPTSEVDKTSEENKK